MRHPLAYVGTRGDLEKGPRSVVVVDGMEGKEHPGRMTSLGVTWSPDSRRWAAGLLNLPAKKASVVVDDVRGPDYDDIAMNVLGWVQGSDTIRQTVLMDLMRNDTSFSADGKHVAYAAGRGNVDVVVLDGKEVVKVEGR